MLLFNLILYRGIEIVDISDCIPVTKSVERYFCLLVSAASLK